MDGSLPLKIPTILAPRPNPYAPVEDININADLSLSGGSKKHSNYGGGGGGGGYAAAASEPIIDQQPAPPSLAQAPETDQQQVVAMTDRIMPQYPFNPSLPTMHPMISNRLAGPGPSYPLSAPQPMEIQRRSSNLRQPYHHHLNNPAQPINDRIEFGRLIAGGGLRIPQPNYIVNRFISPMQTMGVSQQQQQQQQQQSNRMSRQMSIELSDVNQEEISNQEHRPMKINIGEHYDPNMIYMDEQLMPSNMDETTADLDESEKPVVTQFDEDLNADPMDSFVAESNQYYSKYGGGKKKYKDDGPDDIRIDFSLTGPHGGPMVPYGFGRDQEQLNKQLNQIQQHIPIGLHAKQIYNYYLRHTFSEPAKPWPYSYAKVKKVKLLPKRKKPKPPPPPSYH